MPLTLSRREGEDFYVGETRVVVESVITKRRFILAIEDPDAKEAELFEIVEDRSSEILPDVFVSAGDDSHTNQASVVIDAPRRISILRGEKRR